jgi:catechol 1,2-dioxygenase
MASKLVQNIAARAIAAMRASDPKADPDLQRKLAVVVRHLLEAVEEVQLTETELPKVCDFLNDVARQNEWRFMTHVFGVEMLVNEMDHGGEARRTVDNVEGPLYRPNAPMLDKDTARIMREDEPGRRLVLEGTVRNVANGRPVANALIDVWQANAVGAYAEDDATQPEWNFRRRLHADASGRYRIETVVPGAYEIGDASGMACGRLLTSLGRHRMRPGHIHLKISGAGMKPMTTMLYFRGEPYLDTDSIFSVRDDIILDFPWKPGDDTHTASFDLALEPAGDERAA